MNRRERPANQNIIDYIVESDVGRISLERTAGEVRQPIVDSFDQRARVSRHTQSQFVLFPQYGMLVLNYTVLLLYIVRKTMPYVAA